jgi:hypothetical protein
VLLPVPVAEQAHPGIVERVLHGAVDALSQTKQRVADGADAAREQIAEGTAHIKQHAAASYYRAIDPTPLAGVRPGAAAATIAGCLAIGGGATYCVERGIDPTRAFTGAATSQRHAAKPHEKQKPIAAAASAIPTATPTPQAIPQPTATAQTTPEPTATAQPTSTPEPAAPQDEYEPVNPAAGAHATQSSSAPKEPAPAAAGGPGEFDGP